MMTDFQSAYDRLEGIIKKDATRNNNPFLLQNLKSLYENNSADANQKKDVLKVILFCLVV